MPTTPTTAATPSWKDMLEEVYRSKSALPSALRGARAERAGKTGSHQSVNASMAAPVINVDVLQDEKPIYADPEPVSSAVLCADASVPSAGFSGASAALNDAFREGVIFQNYIRDQNITGQNGIPPEMLRYAFDLAIAVAYKLYELHRTELVVMSSQLGRFFWIPLEMKVSFKNTIYFPVDDRRLAGATKNSNAAELVEMVLSGVPKAKPKEGEEAHFSLFSEHFWKGRGQAFHAFAAHDAVKSGKVGVEGVLCALLLEKYNFLTVIAEKHCDGFLPAELIHDVIALFVRMHEHRIKGVEDAYNKHGKVPRNKLGTLRNDLGLGLTDKEFVAYKADQRLTSEQVAVLLGDYDKFDMEFEYELRDLFSAVVTPVQAPELASAEKANSGLCGRHAASLFSKQVEPPKTGSSDVSTAVVSAGGLSMTSSSSA